MPSSPIAVYRYRHRKGSKAHYEPENKKLEWWLTAITSVGIAAMLAPGLSVWAKFVTVPDEATAVEVLGQQWNWSYRLPGRDGALGKTDVKLMTLDNPFGIDPNDPVGQDDVLVNSPQLHLPINKPVKLLLRAKDVNHQFAVPQFRVKMDMVPGMVTYFWFTPTRTGEFDALCEQLCGVAHYIMRGRVVVDEQDEVRHVARDATDVCENARPDGRRCDRRPSPVRDLQRVSRRQRRRQSRSQRAEAERPSRLVSRATAARFQERSARHAREGHVRQADGAVRIDAYRRRSDSQRRRVHHLAAGSACTRHGPRQSRARARRHMPPAPRATARRVRASGQRARRALRT